MLISQEKGGTIKLWTVTNSCYALQRAIAPDHLAFCRSVLYTSAATGTETLFYPHGENSIGVLHLQSALGAGDSTTQFLIADDPQLPKLGSICCLKPFECDGQMFVLAGYEEGTFLTWDVSSSRVIDLLRIDESPMAVDYDPLTNRGIIGGPSKNFGY